MNLHTVKVPLKVKLASLEVLGFPGLCLQNGNELATKKR